MDRRSNLLSLLDHLSGVETDAPPAVPLATYFEGNTDEESIAPNQWGYGRPPIAEIYARFKSIEARTEVQCVLVGLHFDWVEALEDETVWPAAENVHIIAAAKEAEVESWIVDVQPDGLFVGWPYGEHPSSPKPGPGHRVFSVCWD